MVSDEWTLSDGSGRAVEDYGYDYALSASGSYSLSMENGSASVYGTSASNDTLAWRDRTEYRYSVADGEWQTNMTGWTRQTAVSGSSYAGSGSGAGTSGDAVSGSSWEAQASEEGAFLRAEVTEIDWSFLDGEYTASGHVHTDYDITGEYGFSSENDFWQSSSSTHSSGWNSYSDTSHNERESNETMVFHHERDENYEWSLDETGRVYVSAYDYEQSGSMSANGHRGGSGTYNYESSSYTQGDGWSSFYHSGSFGSSSFYDEYDFTADWSESFNGVTNSYSSAHSASNDVEGYEYNLSGYFSDYYKTWDGQSPDSGGYSDSYPSSSPYASTTTDNGFSFTWSGHDIASRQGVYLHNAPYSGMWEIPYGLGSYSNPVEQPSSAWPTDPETPEPYSSPSQRYVDDLDDFFYGYDNSDLYEQGTQSENGITITTPSNQPISYANYGSSGLALVSAPPTSGEGEALFGSDYSSSDTFDDVWNILQEILHSASDDIIVPLSDAQFASLSTLLQNSREQAQAESDPPPQLANNPWTFMDSVHLVLDGIGLFPVIGDSADGVNAVLYWHEGNYTDAALSAASMIPLAGSSVTAAKWGKKGCEAAQTASKLADATKRGERITDIITEAAELERDSSKAAKAFKWTAASIHDPRFRDGCEEFAQRIHESIGGKIVRIEALPNRLGNPSPLPQYRGGNNKWFYHEVVVKDGKVYDAFTNSSGETIEQFKKHWNDQYRIIIWPF